MTAQFLIGDRVTAIVCGLHQSGVVTGLGRSIVFVQWYGSSRSHWMHPESLTLIA